MKKIKNYRKAFLFSCLTAFFLVILFLAGCQSKRARLLKETSWYSASVKWYGLGNAVNRLGGLHFNTPSIWIGKIVKLEHQPNGDISGVYLEEAERLKPYSMFFKDLRLFASKEDFNICPPKVGEYWAFRVNRNIKGMMGVIKAVKIIYDADSGKLGVFDPSASCDKSKRFINDFGKGSIVVLNGLQITDKKHIIIPAKLKVRIKKEMTLREIVNTFGRGWMPKLSSTRVISWGFSDNTVMSIWFPESLDKKVTVRILKTYRIDEVSIILRRTMQQISSDLKKIKTKFPQLENIDSAKIEINSFYYSKGWVRDSKTQGVIFDKNGCDIWFRVRYPAESKEIQQLASSPLIKIKNGKNIQFWRSVRAENTEQGRQFTDEVNKIISKNILKMRESLGCQNVRISPNLRAHFLTIML